MSIAESTTHKARSQFRYLARSTTGPEEPAIKESAGHFNSRTIGPIIGQKRPYRESIYNLDIGFKTRVALITHGSRPRELYCFIIVIIITRRINTEELVKARQMNA